MEDFCKVTYRRTFEEVLLLIKTHNIQSIDQLVLVLKYVVIQLLKEEKK